MTGFAWLIEAPGQRYLAVRQLSSNPPDFFWTTEASKALRFFSKEQADLTAGGVRYLNPDLWGFSFTLGEAWPREHGWLSASPASPTERPALPRETVKSEVSATDAKLSGAWHKPSQLLTAERMADYLNRTLARGVTITSEIIECAALICGPSPEVTEADREWARRASEIPEIKAGLPVSALTALPGGGRSSSVADSAPSLHGDDIEAEGH